MNNTLIMENENKYMGGNNIQEIKYDVLKLTLSIGYDVYVLYTYNDKLPKQYRYILGITYMEAINDNKLKCIRLSNNVYDDLSIYKEYGYIICNNPYLNNFKVSNIQFIDKVTIDVYIEVYAIKNNSNVIISNEILPSNQVFLPNLKSIISKNYGHYIYQYDEDTIPFDHAISNYPKFEFLWAKNSKIIDFRLSNYYGWYLDLYIYKYPKITMDVLAYVMSKETYCAYFKINEVKDKYRIVAKFDEDFDNNLLLSNIYVSIEMLYDILYKYDYMKLVNGMLV